MEGFPVKRQRINYNTDKEPNIASFALSKPSVQVKNGK